MGCLVRMKLLSEVKKTPDEKKLQEQRLLLMAWESRGLGLEFPATPEVRLMVGQKIRTLKQDLVDSGLYNFTGRMEPRMGNYNEENKT